MGWGNYKSRYNLSPEAQVAAGTANDVFDARHGVGAQIAALQDNGRSTDGAPRLLEDAYINWHNCLPYHDITVGQFLVGTGEEGLRSDAELDFVERSMVWLQQPQPRRRRQHPRLVLGARTATTATVASSTGSACVQRRAGSYLQPGESQNRADNNQSKDFNARMLVRPLWSDCMGHLELGASALMGQHGQSSGSSLGYYNPLDTGTPQWGLDRPSVWAEHYNAWASYKFGSFISGMWARAELSWIKDSNNPLSNVDFTGAGSGTDPNLPGLGQAGKSVQGWYGALGYRFADACWISDCSWLKPVELAARYEQYQNVLIANEADATLQGVSAYYSHVATAGFNYYVKGHNAKIQANYNWVEPPMDHQSAAHHFHKTDLNNFVLNFQVAF